jgi:hypothetical protein
MVRVLYALQSLFGLWMMVDASRRGAARYWYPIIFLPFGPFVYFFVVKIHDPEFRALKGFFSGWSQSKVTLDYLRHKVAETPSLANKLALAQGLFDAQLHEEAVAGFERVLASDSENKDALYGIALCRLETKDYTGAIEPLEQVIEIKASYREYAAWPRLAYALQRSERSEAALTLLDELVRKAPRVAHRVLYARYLRDADHHSRAREQLERALVEHEHSPRYQKRQDAAAVRSARNLLAELKPG